MSFKILEFHSTVSAGFDAADGDELGECHVTPAGFAHMTHMLAGLAGGKMVVALEVTFALFIV
jgi:acetoin utilization deacetylase AcuC-like enzyme